MDKIGATTYIECSAKTGEGCQEVVDAAVVAVLDQEGRDKTTRKKQSKGLFSRLFQ